MITEKTPLNIWFNRAFATAYWLIKMVKENPDGVPVTVFATHADPTSPVLQAADHAGLESSATGEDYIDWALNFCIANKIDVFVPRNNINIIAEHAKRFAEIGVKVLASDAVSIRLLEDKNLTYLKAKATGTPVPPWRIGNTVETLKTAYESLLAELEPSDRVVIKPTVGVGAQGFRVIDNELFTMDELLKTHPKNVHFDRILEAYQAQQDAGVPTQELMLLPWLESPEISLDCLTNQNGHMVKTVPRVKEGGRITSFSSRYPEARNIVEKFYTNFQLKYLTNTQLRWWRGELVLLETNTRAAGGLFSTTLTGVNLMWDAVRLAVYGEASAIKPELGSSYISMETFTAVKNEPFSL